MSSKNTIFVQMAAYRDPELRNTIKDLLTNAKYPNNLKICIAWQHAQEDEWDNLDEYQNDKRFIILDFDYKKAKGACWARHQIQQQYNDEKYTLQLDSHHRFIKNWDVELIKMYKNLEKKGHKKPLITGYLPSYFPNTEQKTEEVWQMNFDLFAPEGYIFTRPGVIPNWRDLKEPIPARFYSAHFTFTTGKFCEEVQHDPRMYFHGEEPSIAARAYTWGYDLFHPHKIIAWHEYTREGKKKHWDDDKDWNIRDKVSHERYRILHEMDEMVNCRPCQKKQLGKYTFGTERTLRDYEKYIGVRFRDRGVQQYTLDGKLPPNPYNEDDTYFDNSMLFRKKHCIDIHKSHFKENDYDFWVISFEKNDGTVVYRQDADENELQSYLKNNKDWYNIWRQWNGEEADKWVIWPHSKSKGWVERYEQEIKK